MTERPRGIDEQALARWVEAGHCHKVRRTKAWCSGPANHRGQHYSPLLLETGRTQNVYWDDSEALPDIPPPSPDRSSNQ